MSTPEEIREQILTQALEELKHKAGAVIESIMGDLYSDYLPHVVGDTEGNISNRVIGCIKNIIQGRIRELEDHPNFFYVNDGYGYDHLVSIGSYGLNLKPLCDIMGETIQTNRIKQLEQEVQSLKQQLQDSYRRY
ncbi:hypothetical protein [Pseudomonas phage vB_PsaM_M1]|nr:hypothetical protein [Pseudomonas phage vB_PsaM_M1]